MLAHLLGRALARFGRLVDDRRGNVAPIFAIAIIPIIGFVGAAIDYSRASSARTDMQAALDSVALMLAKENNGSTLTQTQLDTKANAYFSAMYNRPDSTTAPVKVSYDPTTQTLVLSGSGTVKTTFMNVLGFSQIDFSTSSTAKWGNTRLRVALALDNTGSMAYDNKMTALKTASHNLLSTLKAAAKQDADVYVSIIPFSKDVNVGSANKNQPWLKWSGDSDTFDETNGTCSKKPRNGSYTNKSDCKSHSGTWTSTSHNSWNGCVMDRDQSYDVLSTAPATGANATLFPPEQYDYCPTTVMGMSYDWTALNSKIDDMTPVGATNQPIGLVWAWHSLTQTAPLAAPALDANYQYTQVIILLSDGLNTQDRWYGNGSDVSSDVDARMNLVCANAKAANIEIYTVQVNTGGDPTSTVLKNCATDASHFFMLTSADQIVTTFAQIGTNLSKLRIAY